MKTYRIGSTDVQIAKFSTLGVAESFAARCAKLHMVMLGDDGMYWVVKAADGEKLYKLGYEYA